jgi:hypothetical protein
MSDLNNAVVNNMEKRQRDNLPMVRGRVGHLRTFERQFHPATEEANPPKIEFFDAVACLEAGLAQFDNTPGQRSQAIGQRWF